MSTSKSKSPIKNRHKLALVIPAHNEEVLLESTIKSAIAAGQPKEHIYVVDDASTDNTYKIATKILKKCNVLKVEHSGKAGAIAKAFEAFNIRQRYVWLHIADADGQFGKNYFKTFTRRLNGKKYAAATGHVQSLPGGWISKFRTYEYTIGLEIARRLQYMMGTITVIPGPTSCFRTDVFAKLDPNTGSLTEDFDMTLQLYRKNLGKIKYIPEAKTYTQDPLTYKDFLTQITRWYRGYFQGIRRHKIGFRPTKIDAYIAITCVQTWWYALTLLLLIPLAVVNHHPVYTLSMYFLYDLVFFFVWVIFSASFNSRLDVIAAFPLFYLLRMTNVVVFVKSGIEILILRRFTNLKPGWETSSRRYRAQA